MSPRGGPRPIRPPGLGLRPRGPLPPHLLRLQTPSIRLNQPSQSQPVSESAVVAVSGEPRTTLKTTLKSEPASKPQTSQPQPDKPLLASKLTCDRPEESKDATVNVSGSESKTELLVIHS